MFNLLDARGVISVTVEQLHPGVRLVPDRTARVAAVKGSAAMIKLLAAAVADRQRPPTESLVAWYGSRRLQIPADRLQQFFARAQRHRTHNAGAGSFRNQIVDTLLADVYEPGFGKPSEIRESVQGTSDVRRFMERHWPVLTPEQALNDLFGSPALLRAASRAAGLDEDDMELLACARTPETELGSRVWEHADVPLLDELHYLLGDTTEAVATDADMEHAIADEAVVFTLAEEAEAGDETADVDDGIEVDLELEDIEHYDGWREGDEEATWR